MEKKIKSTSNGGENKALKLVLLLGLFIPAHLAAQPCGTPGKDGVGNPAGVINTYYPGTASVLAGATSIPVGTPTGSGTPIAAGDMLLVIQMQSAIINSTNTSAYGDGSTGAGYTSLNGAGQFEYVIATGSVAGGLVHIQGANGGGLVHAYLFAAYTGSQGQETYQVVRVPQYSSAALNTGLTAAHWNGSTGGILAMDVAGALNLNNATASVDGEGFRGGGSRNLNGGSGGVTSDMATVSTLGYYDTKGEGIAGTPRYVFDPVGLVDIDTGVEGYPGGSFARGAPGNAGGGGTDSHPIDNGNNAGGGGGGNGGPGGTGGNSFYDDYVVGGLGGAPYPAAASQMVLGGGGGTGDQNNSLNGQSSGGAGGGMVFVRAGSVTGTGTLSANGLQGLDTTALDATGGGGAGGSVLVVAVSGNLSGLTVSATGGRGGNTAPNGPVHGPGGGGAGGVALLSSAPAAVNTAGGAAGLSAYSTVSVTSYGAQTGQTGASNTSLNLSQIPGATFCFSTVTPLATGCQQFMDSYGSASSLSNYTYTDGVWNASTAAALNYSTVSGELQESPSAGATASSYLATLNSLVSSSLGNYTVEADFKLDSWTGNYGLFGLMFRETAVGKAYIFQLNGNPENPQPNWQVEKQLAPGGVSYTYLPGSGFGSGAAAPAYTLGTWVHLKVVAQGNLFNCYVNSGGGDQLVFSVSDPGASVYAAGAAGIRTIDLIGPNTLHIRNFTVTWCNSSAYPGDNPPSAGEAFIYPSPARGSQATVAYNMEGSGRVDLRVWNEKAELVTHVIDSKPPGVQVTPFSIAGFGSGVYFYSLTLTYDSGQVQKLASKKFAILH